MDIPPTDPDAPIPPTDDGWDSQDAHPPDETLPADADVATASAKDQPPQDSPDAGAEETLATVWYVSANQQTLGPFAETELHERLRSGVFLPRHFAWRYGFGKTWYRLREIAEFRETIRDVAPRELRGEGQSPAVLRDRLSCPNCLTPIALTWSECPRCGLTLKLAPGPELDPEASRRSLVFGSLVGTMLMGLGLLLPWFQGDRLAQTPGTATPLASLLWLVVGVLAVLVLQQGLIVRSRPVPRTCNPLSLWLLAALTLYQTGAFLLNVPTDLAWGVWVFGVGLLAVFGVTLTPALQYLWQRPLRALSLIAAFVLLSIGIAHWQSGDFDEPFLRWTAEQQGFQVQQVETLPATASPDADVPQVEGPRRYRLILTKAHETYLAETAIAPGSLLEAARLRLMHIPDEDVPLLARGQDSAGTGD